jgi:hypothetical protein
MVGGSTRPNASVTIASQHLLHPLEAWPAIAPGAEVRIRTPACLRGGAGPAPYPD